MFYDSVSVYLAVVCFCQSTKGGSAKQSFLGFLNHVIFAIRSCQIKKMKRNFKLDGTFQQFCAILSILNS